MKVGCGTFHYLWFRQKKMFASIENVEPIKKTPKLHYDDDTHWLLENNIGSCAGRGR